MQENKTCRNCLGGAENGTDFIAPCMCSGSSKYVHRHCLDQWRVLSNNPRSFHHCDVCNFKYRTKVEKSPIPAKAYCKYGTLICLDLFIFFVLIELLVGLSIGLYILLDRYGIHLSNSIFRGLPLSVSYIIGGHGFLFFWIGVLSVCLFFTYVLVSIIRRLCCSRGRSKTRHEIIKERSISNRRRCRYRHGHQYDIFGDSWLMWMMFYYWSFGFYGPSFMVGPAPLICFDPDVAFALCFYRLGSGSGRRSSTVVPGSDDSNGLLILLIVIVAIFIGIGAVVGLCFTMFVIYKIFSSKISSMKRNERMKRIVIVDMDGQWEDEYNYRDSYQPPPQDYMHQPPPPQGFMHQPPPTQEYMQQPPPQGYMHQPPLHHQDEYMNQPPPPPPIQSSINNHNDNGYIYSDQNEYASAPPLQSDSISLLPKDDYDN
mmetsp:Transcript_6270/g.9113  ORF Transcript_6270/g.9113 Transcript_6270/m.9113 type:complete len:428 (-) Transcript_6270:49-1332(-)